MQAVYLGQIGKAGQALLSGPRSRPVYRFWSMSAAQGFQGPVRFPDMTEGQPIFREDRIGEILEKARRCLEQGAFAEASALLEQALEVDVEHPGVASALKCAAFWKERQEREKGVADPYEKGELYLGQWKVFRGFAEKLGDVPDDCMTAVRQHVFSTALAHYLKLEDGDAGGDPEVHLRAGRCCKGLGDFGRAIELLESANRERRESAEVLAELADCYSLVDETRSAKVFFREAFFLDPGAIELSLLESPLIVKLAEKVRAQGVPEDQVADWIPVYATIWGVFNVKREMKPLELGRLKQSIYALEKGMEDGSAGPAARPRLLNRYFWLVDHYLTAGETRERIDDVLARIKDLDPRVHKHYAT
jgi:tetratricopeptide (TPR) repeat protein